MKGQKEKTAKGDKTRLKILGTAVRMMSEKGPDAVSMREIASHLNITKPVLYYYFKDKETLIRAAFQEGSKHFRELDPLVLDEASTLEKKIALILGSHLSFIKKHPDMPKCALKIIASPSEGALSGMALEIKKEHRKKLKRIISSAAGKGEVAEEAAADILHLVSASLTYFLIEAKESGAAALDAGIPARFARIICAGSRGLKTAAMIMLLCAAPACVARAGAAGLPGQAGREPRGRELSLNDAVETALKNNATVVTAEETRNIYKEKVKEYWGTVFPQLSASGQYTRNIESPAFFFGGTKITAGLKNAYAGSLDLDQVLWAGGKVYTGIRMARLYADDSDERLKTARNEISKSVKQMYYAVLLSSSLAAIQRESLNLAVQHLGTIEAQYKQGMASDLMVLRQKVEVSNTEPALTQAWNLYEEGLIELKTLLGLDPETNITLTDSLACAKNGLGGIDELYKTALLNRPEYRDARLQRDLYREMIKIEQAGHYPYVSAFASRQFQGQSDSGFPGKSGQSWSTTAGLRLSLPIFSGGSASSRVRQARFQAEIAETNLKELERRIKIEVKKAWLGLKEASMRLESQTASVETARKTLTATEIRFRNGLASQLELNDTSLALNKSQTLYIQALHDTCSDDAELKWTIGE
ncbi:MAG: TolC family protein [Elusimicrobiales bacterium]|jgi:outer membrane protein TolC